MVIAKSAIQAFLNRRLRDSRKAKRFSNKALDAKLAALDPPPEFHTRPRKHQKVAFLLGLKRQHYLFFLDTGTGKSWTSISLYDYARRLHAKDRQPFRALVLVPGSSNVGQWVMEVEKHTPHLSVAGIDVSGSGERMLLVRGTADVVVITYAGFLALICSGKPAADKETGALLRGKDGEILTKGWRVDKKKLAEWQRLFQFVIIDESTFALRGRGLTFNAVKTLSWAAEYSYGLTGTPYGKKPLEDLWPQFYVIDKGETLGPTLGLARAAFCREVQNYWSGGVDYVFDARKKHIFSRVIRHGSLRYSKAECIGLPKRVEVIRPVIFDPETWQYYDRLVQDIRKAHGAVDVIDSAFLRMRQLTAGYLVLKDAEGGRQIIRFKKSPKIEAVLDWIREIPDTDKIVLFHEYQLTGEILTEALKKAKVRHVWLYGKTRKKNEVVQRFLKDPAVRILVSSSAGAFGNNWQIANYVGFVESPVNPILRQQEMDRVYRMGQEKTVIVTDFVVKGSVDAKILESLKEGKSLYDLIIEGGADLGRRPE